MNEEGSVKIIERAKKWGLRLINKWLDPQSQLLTRTPESVEARLAARYMFGNLSPKEKQAILTVVFDEVQRSRDEFGLLIAPGHVYMEEFFFLNTFNYWQGLGAVRILGFDATFKRVSREMDTYFSELKEHYFKQEQSKPGSQLNYNCHLEAVRSRLMLEIFNDRI